MSLWAYPWLDIPLCILGAAYYLYCMSCLLLTQQGLEAKSCWDGEDLPSILCIQTGKATESAHETQHHQIYTILIVVMECRQYLGFELNWKQSLVSCGLQADWLSAQQKHTHQDWHTAKLRLAGRKKTEATFPLIALFPVNVEGDSSLFRFYPCFEGVRCCNRAKSLLSSSNRS